jgi:hypothetical protein
MTISAAAEILFWSSVTALVYAYTGYLKLRVIGQTFTDLWRHRWMLDPLRGGFYAMQLWSHEVMRYMEPVSPALHKTADGKKY